MGKIHAVMCFAYTNQIPKNVDELDKFSHDAYTKCFKRSKCWQDCLAYTVWSKKKRWGKIDCKEVFKKVKNPII